ncbi:MAG TPA: DUF86 domain-containing protein [Candidatus Nanoarchaeia archaeon]|nr:DUF86 domain-containing protein [Candidatus Nanoarchaeia archaeon]
MNKDMVFIEHILSSIRLIKEHTEGYSKQDFTSSRKTQDAVIRNIEIIGEAAKNVSPQFQKSHPELPWKEMIRTRDKLIHGYFGVDLEIVWDVITHELPALEKVIEEIVVKK